MRSAGFSILPLRRPGAIGKFVPLGTLGTLDDKETLQVRVDDIHDTRSVPLSPIHYRNLKKTLAVFLSAPDVASSIWRSKGASVTIQESTNGKGAVGRASDSTMIVVRKTARSKGLLSPVITCRAATLPNKARIARVARANAADEVTVLVSATSRHIVALRFDCREKPAEVTRVSFELGK